MIATIIEQIADANPTRDYLNLNRRMLKLIEELGELAEAFLECTSIHNHKQKTWDDVKEESADVLIVAIDIALTIDSGSSLAEYVRQNSHRINCGFDTIIREICYAMARFDGSYKQDRTVASAHIRTAVCYAFALNQDDDALLNEVNRKLEKWRSGVSTAACAITQNC